MDNETRYVLGYVAKDLSVPKAAGCDKLFVCSTQVIDRTAEVIEQRGWELGRFGANPVMLACHMHRLADGRSPVIGSWPYMEVLDDAKVAGAGKTALVGGAKFAATELGKEYKSLREMLMKDGKLKAERASLMGIKEYFKAHPEDLDVYLPRNERYVFFQDMRGGPYGSLGVPVTMNCSLATDKTGSREIYPRGCVAFIQTKIPTASSGKTETRKYSGFILDQDTGGAIRSAGRADIYMGIGPNAEMLAGHTAAEGRVYYIFVKQAMLDSSSALEEAPAKGPARAKPLPAVRTAPKM